MKTPAAQPEQETKEVPVVPSLAPNEFRLGDRIYAFTPEPTLGVVIEANKIERFTSKESIELTLADSAEGEKHRKAFVAAWKNFCNAVFVKSYPELENVLKLYMSDIQGISMSFFVYAGTKTKTSYGG